MVWARWEEGGRPHVPHTQALMPDRSTVATCPSHPNSFLPRAGHGMDSRPAMAIFELLDYIVNEVRAHTEKLGARVQVGDDTARMRVVA